MEPEKPATGRSQAAIKAWGKALVKTGKEHLDLGMIRQGKRVLHEAEMKEPDAPPKSEALSDFTEEGLRAWGNALVKTGTEHLDLSMVRQGKKALKDADAMV